MAPSIHPRPQQSFANPVEYPADGIAGVFAGPTHVPAVLHPLKISSHPVRIPRSVRSKACDGVPIIRRTRHRYHRVVKGATSYTAGTRVKDSVWIFPLRVTPVLCCVAVMPDKIFPADGCVFRRERVECRNLGSIGEVSAAGLDQQNTKLLLGKIAGKRAATGAGPNDDEIIGIVGYVRRSHFPGHQLRMSSANRRDPGVPAR